MTIAIPTDPWLLASYIANCIVALVAIGSLYLSIKSSKEVTTALLSIQRGLVSLTEPLVKVVDHKWASDTTEISCENPPIGLFFIYQNLSNVPVVILKTDFKVFFGERELNEVVRSMGSTDGGTQVLAPGQTLQSGTVQKDLFQRYLCQPKDPFQPPHMNVRFTIDYESLVTRERYTYESHQEVFFNCAQPAFHGGRSIRETHARKATAYLPENGGKR